MSMKKKRVSYCNANGLNCPGVETWERCRDFGKYPECPEDKKGAKLKKVEVKEGADGAQKTFL